MKKQFVLTDGSAAKALTVEVMIPQSQVGTSNSVSIGGAPAIYMPQGAPVDKIVSQIHDAIDWESELELSLACTAGDGRDWLSFIPSAMEYANCDIRICETILWTAVDYTHQFFADEAVK